MEKNIEKNYIEGKVVVITGASSGFGKLVSEKVAERGGIAIMGARRENLLKEVADGIIANGGKAFYRITDVAKYEDVKALVDLAVEKCGRIDVMINNAGTMPLSFFSDHEKSLPAWHNCIDVNIKGVVNGISAVYDLMMKQGQGQVINLSSIYANHPVMGSGVYQATKIATWYLSETLRQEAQGKIKVTTVKPTGIAGTGLFDCILNWDSVKGMFGAKTEEGLEMTSPEYMTAHPECTDIESISYAGCDPNTLAENIMYVINQPWGVNISDITVRASNERYLL
ncbi:MAG: SDR family oxidoreductase [Lachnospiraceae bacterium]|nr:SDR family oxidoreductase [Lachnospiraceae bacterium]MDD3617142.1 SDR family oxidoreductase [Lachnospiraceae bacterium]